jgi:hypothetical protein
VKLTDAQAQEALAPVMRQIGEAIDSYTFQPLANKLRHRC